MNEFQFQKDEFLEFQKTFKKYNEDIKIRKKFKKWVKSIIALGMMTVQGFFSMKRQ